MGSIFGGSRTQTTEVSYPGYVRRGGKEAVGIAQNVAEQPYVPYEGERVAPLTPQQQAALGRAGTGAGMIQQGFGLAGEAGNIAWSPEVAEQYMNPYRDIVFKRINEQAAQNAIQGRAGLIHQGGRGAFGDPVLEGEFEQARLDAIAAAEADAYERARGAFETEQGRRLGAAGLQGTLGGQYGALTAADYQLGAAAQEQEQRQLNVMYGDFVEERDWPLRGLEAYVRALGGIPTPQTQTTSGAGSSPLQQVAGAGIAATGLYQMFNPAAGAAGPAAGAAG